jgi:hypothetical protein
LTKRDVGASVRERLANQARAKQRPFQELLQYYAMERFLYRLSRSRHANEFVLKGALLMTAWQAPLARSTMDIDLLGRTSNELDHIRTVFAGLCDIESEPDGVFFDSKSVKVARIKEDADYEGTRVRFHATLARARIPMQIDIGFGDVIVPSVAYPKETVIAEKLEALTILGALNSRMKDFYDLWALSRLYAFEGSVLLKAIQATFARRETVIEATPFGLDEEFANDSGRSMQWTAFLRRSRIASAPVSLAETVLAIREFAHPVLSAAASGRPLDQNWRAGGPWSF